MRLNDIILEAEGNQRYKISIKYKDEDVKFYFSREKLLKHLLNSTSFDNTVNLLVSIIAVKLEKPEKEIDKKEKAYV